MEGTCHLHGDANCGKNTKLGSDLKVYVERLYTLESRNLDILEDFGARIVKRYSVEMGCRGSLGCMWKERKWQNGCAWCVRKNAVADYVRPVCKHNSIRIFGIPIVITFDAPQHNDGNENWPNRRYS